METVKSLASDTVDAVGTAVDTVVSTTTSAVGKVVDTVVGESKDDITESLSEEFKERNRVVHALMSEAAEPQAAVLDNNKEWVVQSWREAKDRLLGDLQNEIDISTVIHDHEVLAPPVADDMGFVEMDAIVCPKCFYRTSVLPTDKPSRRTCPRCSATFVA